MQRGTQLFVAAIFAVTAAACGNNGMRGNDTGTPGAAGTSGSATALDMGERNFVQDQLKDGSREVELGQLAEKRAASPDVKEFAAMMVQDHTRAGNKLKDVAKKENVELEKDDDARDNYERLSKLSGGDFDKEYIDLMVKDHKDAVDALQDQANNADHADVKTWAAETLPRVKHHLEVAQQIQDKLNNTDNSDTKPTAKKYNPKKP